MSPPAKNAQSSAIAKSLSSQRERASFSEKVTYAARVLPGLTWQRIVRNRPTGRVHLIIALADHFEPAIVPDDGQKRASSAVQEERVARWCKEYPRVARDWRDSQGFPFQHTYFYPAEQFDGSLIDRLAEHCSQGWGEIEIHLHHGTSVPDTPENTRHTLASFRNQLEQRRCVSYMDGIGPARYAFVHGNFALANSAGGRFCGLDSEMQILSETGCYADLTLPAATLHPAQIAKTNSLYECGLPLNHKAPHATGSDLEVGRAPRIFPLIVQGPLVATFGQGWRPRIENGALVRANPPSIRRLHLWRRAAVTVNGRPDWLFIKLHCHSMDPTHEPAVIGEGMRTFLKDLVSTAANRNEILHFTSGREMVNIALAACDGKNGNPSDYRDYRLKRARESMSSPDTRDSQAMVKG